MSRAARRFGKGAALAGAVAFAACELPTVTVPGGKPVVVVSAVMRPDLQYQYVIVEQSLTGDMTVVDSAAYPIPPYAPQIPIRNAVVTVGNLDLPTDTCGVDVTFRAAPYDPTAGAVPGVYWAPAGCPTMRAGDRLQLRVETPDGQVVMGTTRVPGMRGAFVAAEGDSVALGSGDSLLTFNRDRDTVRFGVDPIVGRLVQLEIRHAGDLTDYGTDIHVDTTEFLLAGNAENIYGYGYGSGAGQDVFRGGRIYKITLSLSDTNYFDYSRSRNNEFTGRGFINRLSGGIGVFGSAVAATGEVWAVADFNDPREGLYHLTGQVRSVTIDAALRLYVTRSTDTTDISAFFEGAWFGLRPVMDSGDIPVPKTVSRYSIEGVFQGALLHLVVPDTLADGVTLRRTTLQGVFGGADSIPIVVGDSVLAGTLPLDTILAVRQHTP